MPENRSPPPDAPLGPFEANLFRLTTGTGAGDRLHPAARSLFASETIAVPVSGPFAQFARETDPYADLAAWGAHPGPPTRPPLVWIAAPERKPGATLAPDGRTFSWEGVRAPLVLVPKIALNRAWADASTFAWLSHRLVTMRGETRPDGAFVARTLWPEDWRVDAKAPAVDIGATREPGIAIRGLFRSAPRGGVESPPETHPLWERDPGSRDWAGRPAIALVLNGAQGDDDEAWGGHFALATGRLPADGRLSDFLVANFYTLETFSEKGTLPAPVPLDNYLADLNSGQSWYRPCYVLLAILADDRAPLRIQGGLNRLYLQFWRRQLPYRHSTMNCAGISIDALRALGWSIPRRGPTAALLAWLAIPAKIFAGEGIAAARSACEYLREDRTRLLPSAAFEEAASSLLRIARRGAANGDGELAGMLSEDLVALAGVRLPQIPSQRPFGTWPVASVREFLAVLPRDPADLRVVPVPAREFPDSLRDPDLLAAGPRAANLAIVLWTITGVLPLAWMAGALRRLLRPRPR